MEGQAKHLKIGGILGYGSGAMASQIMSSLVSFALLFMTDYMGMNSAAVATLMAISKVFDGITDVLAGTIIDNTRSKMGRARVWLLRMTPIMIIMIVLFFFNPQGASDVVKYAYFFISYTLFNDVFFTMYFIAHGTMPLLMTDNDQERVILSILNFMGGVIMSALISGSYLLLINSFGGGVRGWRITAMVYGGLFFILQMFYVLGAKEMSSGENGGDGEQKEKSKLLDNIKCLLKNRYFLIQVLIFLLYTASTVFILTAMPYYCIRILGDTDGTAGTQSLIGLVGSGVIIGLFAAPVLMKKTGIYKANLYSRFITVIFFICSAIGVYANNFTMMLIFMLLGNIAQGPYLGTMNVLTGDIVKYSMLTQNRDMTATVASCNSMGTKIGNALGTASVGWLLSTVHYVGTDIIQPPEVLSMIKGMYAFAPIIFQAMIAVLLLFMNVQKANRELAEYK